MTSAKLTSIHCRKILHSMCLACVVCPAVRNCAHRTTNVAPTCLILVMMTGKPLEASIADLTSRKYSDFVMLPHRSRLPSIDNMNYLFVSISFHFFPFLLLFQWASVLSMQAWDSHRIALSPRSAHTRVWGGLSRWRRREHVQLFAAQLEV